MSIFFIFLSAIGLTSSFFLLGSVSLTKVGFLFFITLFTLMFLKFKKVFIRISFFDVSVFLTLILAIVSQYHTVNLNESLPIVQSYIYYSVLYFITRTYFYNYPAHINIALKGLLFALLISCIFGFLQFITGSGYMPGTPIRSIVTNGVYRACGLFDDPNYFGLVLACISPLCFLIKSKSWGYSLYAIFAVAILTTLSRASLIIMLIQFIFYFYSVNKNKTIFVLKFFSILVIIVPVFVLLKPDFIVDRMATLLPMLSGNTGQLENSSAERLDLIFAGIKMFLDYPILGLGFGNFQLYTEFYMDFFPRKVFAHNSYLTILTELGIVGFIVWFIPLCILFIRVNKHNCAIGCSLIGLFFSYFFLVAIYFQFLAFFLAIIVTAYQKINMGKIELTMKFSTKL